MVRFLLLLSVLLPFGTDFNATFIQEKKSGDLILKSTGSVSFSKDSGLVWTTEKPFKSVLEVTDSKIRQTIEGEEIKVESSIDKSIAKTILAIVSGDNESLNENFFVENESVFIPRSTYVKKYLKEIKVEDDSIVVETANGEISKITFHKE